MWAHVWRNAKPKADSFSFAKTYILATPTSIPLPSCNAYWGGLQRWGRWNDLHAGQKSKTDIKISKKSKKNIRETDGQIMDTCHGIGGPTLMVKLCLNLSSKLCSFHSEPISNANKKKRTNTWLLCVGP